MKPMSSTVNAYDYTESAHFLSQIKNWIIFSENEKLQTDKWSGFVLLHSSCF